MIIENRIKKFFAAEGGEWLCTNENIQEARLLKEAVDRIEQLKDSEAKAWAHYKIAQEIINKNCRAVKDEAKADKKHAADVLNTAKAAMKSMRGFSRVLDQQLEKLEEAEEQGEDAK